ncbi:MAG: winged helix-turn-helix transcriptional regulator [Desulfobacteraceae bacterium]|nr:MAG: winged helix-turn-helix transcriptional regulator [Desulfobacteraceae bacterium]
MRDREYIQSLGRGFRILELFGEHASPLSLTEVANHTGLNKTTAQRFLRTLCTLGYVERQENRKFFWGPRILSLGVLYLNSSNLVKVAKPFLDELSGELHRTVNMAVLDGGHVVFLYRREVKVFLKYDLHPGSRLPAHCTASGKVLLAGLPKERLRELLREMELTKVTPRTITDPDLLQKEIARTRRRGYSICDRELSMDLLSIGAPVYDSGGTLFAAANISLLVKGKEESDTAEAIEGLLRAGESISRAVGYRGAYPFFEAQ